MDSQTFDKFLDEALAKVREVLANKGAEYVPGEAQVSRFHNFEKSAALNEESIEQALWGFVTKHIVSLSDMVQVDSTNHSLAAWDEKIGDVINYMIILKAMVHHESAQSVEIVIPGSNVAHDINVGDLDFAQKAKG